MAAEATVDQIIANALTTQQEAETLAQSLINDAQAAASLLVVPVDPGNIPGISLANPASPPTPPSVSIPGLGDPEAPSDDLKTLQSTLSAQRRAAIKGGIINLLPDYLNQYYPCGWIDQMGSLCAQLQSIRTGPATHLKVDVENAIYDRARTRFDGQAIRAKDQVADRFSRLGWVQPPGMAFVALDEVEQENKVRVAEFNRDVAIRQAELEQENVRFAITESRQLLLGIKQAALQYMGLFLQHLGEARADASSVTEAAARMYDQLMQFYRAQLAKGEFQLRGEQFGFDATGRHFQQQMQFHAAGVNGQGLHLRRNMAQFDAVMSKNRMAVEILTNRASLLANTSTELAKAISQIAAAALSSTNTMASLENITTE